MFLKAFFKRDSIPTAWNLSFKMIIWLFFNQKLTIEIYDIF
jgi:hypothetical protein